MVWCPKRVDSTNQKWLLVNAHAHRDVFQADLPWKEMVRLCNINCTEHLHVDATTMRTFQTAIFKFPAVCVCRPRSSGRGEALAVHAKLERWQHC